MRREAEDRLAPPRRLRVYRAESAAVAACHVPLLDGSAATAQAYVDRITRSAWWARTCPPSWMGDETGAGSGTFDTSRSPRRVIVTAHGSHVAGHAKPVLKRHRGRWQPSIGLGRAECAPGRPAIADPWVILHELAHVMCLGVGDNGHGRVFAGTYLALVRRWLGAEAGRALRAAYQAEGMPWRRTGR